MRTLKQPFIMHPLWVPPRRQPELHWFQYGRMLATLFAQCSPWCMKGLIWLGTGVMEPRPSFHRTRRNRSSATQGYSDFISGTSLIQLAGTASPHPAVSAEQSDWIHKNARVRKHSLC